jgi:hypothetical protein
LEREHGHRDDDGNARAAGNDELQHRGPPQGMR